MGSRLSTRWWCPAARVIEAMTAGIAAVCVPSEPAEVIDQAGRTHLELDEPPACRGGEAPGGSLDGPTCNVDRSGSTHAATWTEPRR